MATNSHSNNGMENDLKTDELESTLEKLQQKKLGETDSIELLKLKKLVLTFKKKYKQALEELANKEKVQPPTSETEQKFKEALEDNAALIEQQASLKAMLFKAKEEAAKITSVMESLKFENEALNQEVKKFSRLLASAVSDGEERKLQLENLQEQLRLAEETSFRLHKQKKQYESVLETQPPQHEGEKEERASIAVLQAQLNKIENDKIHIEKEHKESLWLLKEELSLAKEELKEARLRLQLKVAPPEVSAEQLELIDVKRGREHLEEQNGALKETLINVQQELEYVKSQLARVRNQAALAAEKADLAEEDKELKKLREENQTQRLRIEQLMKVISERERRVSELQRYEFSFKKVADINQQYEKEVASQKQLIQDLKKQNEAAILEIQEERIHSQQLERAVEHLRGKSEEVKLDAQTFQDEFQKAQAQVADLKEEGLAYKKQKEELQLSLSQALEENRELEQELRMLASQLERIKQEHLKQGGQLNNQMEVLAQAQGRGDQAIEQRDRAMQELAEKTSALRALEKEQEIMKQTLVKGLKEARDIKQYYQNLANEKSAVLQKTTQMQNHIKDLTDENKRRDAWIEELRKDLEDSKQTMGQLEQVLLKEREKHKDFQQEIKVRDESLSSFAEQIKIMQAKLRSADEGSKDKEIRVVEAQQQFAKKAREVAQLIEINEDLSRQISRLQEELFEAKMRTSESHATLESHAEQLRKGQEQIAATEKKYFKAYERLQEVEAQNRELKKIELKHQQMQQLLANISSVVGSPIGITQPWGLLSEGSKLPTPPTADLGKKIEPKLSAEQEPKEKKLPQQPEDQSLFDQPPNPPTKYKKDLFDKND